MEPNTVMLFVWIGLMLSLIHISPVGASASSRFGRPAIAVR